MTAVVCLYSWFASWLCRKEQHYCCHYIGEDNLDVAVKYLTIGGHHCHFVCNCWQGQTILLVTKVSLLLVICLLLTMSDTIIQVFAPGQLQHNSWSVQCSVCWAALFKNHTICCFYILQLSSLPLQASSYMWPATLQNVFCSGDDLLRLRCQQRKSRNDI